MRTLFLAISILFISGCKSNKHSEEMPASSPQQKTVFGESMDKAREVSKKANDRDAAVADQAAESGEE